MNPIPLIYHNDVSRHQQSLEQFIDIFAREHPDLYEAVIENIKSLHEHNQNLLVELQIGSKITSNIIQPKLKLFKLFGAIWSQLGGTRIIFYANGRSYRLGYNNRIVDSLLTSEEDAILHL